MVSVGQREWAAKNLRASFKTPVTIEDVLISQMDRLYYPFRSSQCWLAPTGAAH